MFPQRIAQVQEAADEADAEDGCSLLLFADFTCLLPASLRPLLVQNRRLLPLASSAVFLTYTHALVPMLEARKLHFRFWLLSMAATTAIGAVLTRKTTARFATFLLSAVSFSLLLAFGPSI